jgi:putative heme-binding domain-containing protein
VIALASSSSRALRIAAVVALRRMSHPGIVSFLGDADEFVVTEAARAINDDLSITAALPALGNLLNTTRFTNEALLRRAINANLRVGTEAALQNLVNYSLKEGAPPRMRAEAIDALRGWARPSVLDRVDGRLRGKIERDPAPLTSKVTAPFIELLKNKELVVRLSAVKAINKLGIKQASSGLMTVLKNDQQAEMRAEALKALAAMDDPQAGTAIQMGLSDKEKRVRVTGLDLLAKVNIPKDLMAKLLSEVIAGKTTEEKQAALLTLGKLPLAHSGKYLDELLDKMAAGKLAPEIYLELGEAADSSRSPQLIAKYKANSAKLSSDELTASYAGSLSGGDPDRGSAIFFSNQNAQCIRCHSYDDAGGNAGPRLNGVAARLTRPQILESIISPSARISQGYGFVSLTLKDGSTAAGFLKEENATNLVLKGSDEPDRIIRKDQVAKRADAPSSMPDIKATLSKKEIRDLVSFLAQLKTE